MNIKHLVGAGAVSIMLMAGVASAQATGASGVNVGTSPVSGSISSGTGVTLGTITLTGPQSGAGITGLPIVFTPGGGAATSNLSNCQVVNNASGQSIGSLSTVGAGASTFNFSTPLNVTNATTTLTVRCDVASTIPSGGMFTIFAGTPFMAPGLGINLDTAPSVPRGSQDVALANISLGAMNSGANINISALPLTITAGNGATMSHLSDCRVRSTANLSGSVSGPITPTGGTSSFTFSPVLSVITGQSSMYALTCDVSSLTPVGGTFTISVNPSSASATNASTGATITPTGFSGTGPNGLPASTSGTVIVSAATGGTGGNGGSGGVGTNTPGVPNTGLGGNLATALGLLLASGLIALGGYAYLSRRRAF